MLHLLADAAPVFDPRDPTTLMLVIGGSFLVLAVVLGGIWFWKRNAPEE